MRLRQQGLAHDDDRIGVRRRRPELEKGERRDKPFPAHKLQPPELVDDEQRRPHMPGVRFALEALEMRVRVCERIYPDQFSDDLQKVVTDYYKTFYNYDLSQDEYNQLVAKATRK